MKALLPSATGFLCVGTFAGGWAVTSGHLLLILALAMGVIAVVRARSGGRLLAIAEESGAAEDRSSFLVSRRGLPASFWCLLIFLTVSFFSVLISFDWYERPLNDLKKLRYLLLPVLCFCVLPVRQFFFGNSERLGKVALLGILGSASLVTVIGLFAMFTGSHPLLADDWPNPNRLSGVSRNVMTYAYTMQFAVLLFLGVALNYGASWLKEKKRFMWGRGLLWCTVAGFGIGLLGMYFSFTRGPVLGLLLGGAVLLLVARAWKLLAVLSISAMVTLGIAYQTNARFVENQKFSNFERVSQWRGAALVFLENPVTGVGYRQLEKNFDSFKERLNLPKDNLRKEGSSPWLVGHAHNNYLEAFAATGIVGGFAFLGFCVFWTRETWSSMLGRVLYLPGIAAFLISGLFECTFLDGEVLTIIMLLYVASQITLDLEASQGAADHNPS